MTKYVVRVNTQRVSYLTKIMFVYLRNRRLRNLIKLKINYQKITKISTINYIIKSIVIYAKI